MYRQSSMQRTANGYVLASYRVWDLAGVYAVPTRDHNVKRSNNDNQYADDNR